MRTMLRAAVALALSGCSSMHIASQASAVASLEPASGSNVRGSVTFTQDGNEVRVHAKVAGLPPNTEHGFHIHEKGDCSSGDGMSTGGHFNPAGKPHGPQSGEHHAGDMPSLVADADGNASASFELKGVTAGGGGPNDLVGHGLIVHKDPDDFKTQPTGNAGARVACGVIVKG